MPPLRGANNPRQAKATDRPTDGTKTAINLPLYAHDVGTRAGRAPSLPPSGSGRAGKPLVPLANRVHRQMRHGQVLLDEFVRHVMEHLRSAR